MSDQKIFPRNLTARAARRVPGNPEGTRLESGVGNCYPGLEFDHRNLDRRFFPGLLVEFVSQDDALAPDPQRRGALVVAVAADDPALFPNPDTPAASHLREALQGDTGTALAAGVWFLSAITQGERRIDLSTAGDPKVPLDGLVVWRLVRGLEPGPVTLELVRRQPPAPADPATPPPGPVTLEGWRRQFVDPRSGVIDPAYAPGEMSQSLCSPWQHDFRDCSCYYWASNHPDVVLAEDLPGEPTLPSGASADPRRALARIDWLRSDRDRARTSDALPSAGENRPTQMDHYEINQRWQELSIVLSDKETPAVYRPRSADAANPFPSPRELAEQISQLATLEHALALEYLYALYSVRSPAEAAAQAGWPALADDVTFVRHFILLVAVSEMMHLRWANQLLWELAEHNLIRRAEFGPQLGVAPRIPTSAAGGPRPRALRPLTRVTLADFVAVEQPSGFIEGQYARVTATLRQKGYPDSLYQLASRIVYEGMEHFSRFRDVDLVLAQYPAGDPPYLRPLTLGDASNPDVQKALGLYRGILDNLKAAYATGSVQDRALIIRARQDMTDLNGVADQLGAKGVGIPFFPAKADPAVT
jgi:hypothetical protein